MTVLLPGMTVPFTRVVEWRKGLRPLPYVTDMSVVEVAEAVGCFFSSQVNAGRISRQRAQILIYRHYRLTAAESGRTGPTSSHLDRQTLTELARYGWQPQPNCN